MYQGNDRTYCWTRDIPHNQAQILVNELAKIIYNLSCN